MQCLRARGHAVAPFKAGPDFLDPMWHFLACEKASYNLDTRMMEDDACRELFADKSEHADVCVIEGVMGLFDGAAGVGGEGSSVHLAKVLNEPVVLVVHAKGMSGSIVPLVEGFVARAKAMDVRITGIIANHVGSEHHASILRKCLEEFHLPPLVAWLSGNSPQLPERHLGLVMPDDDVLPDFSACFHIEQELIAEVRKDEGENNTHTLSFSATQYLCGKIIAVARDTAFCFIYPANLEFLQAQGAQVVSFSPLAGEDVPDAADALWLPGGYPELHAETLSGSASMTSIRAFIESGKPTLAECGGMMILGENLYTHSGQQWSMAGILPCTFMMQHKLAALGYRREAGDVCGHEFHHSIRKMEKDLPSAFSVNRGDAGIRHRHLRASYTHWYFPSQPKTVASWFEVSEGAQRGH